MPGATKPCSKPWALTPDVNVLVAAARGDHPHHAAARSWLEDTLAATETGAAFTLMPMVVASFLRLVTSPKIFVQPAPIADAVGFVDAILAMHRRAPGIAGTGVAEAAASVSGQAAWRQRVARCLAGCRGRTPGRTPRQLRSRLQKIACTVAVHAAEALMLASGTAPASGQIEVCDCCHH